MYETVINSDPPAAGDLRVMSYDQPSRIVTFTFTPSERLAG